MAISLSNVVLLSAIVESFLLIRFASEHLPWKPLPSALALTLVINYALLGCYNFLIYPRFVSPLRHLPGPKGNLPVIGLTKTLFETPPGATYSKWLRTIKNDGLIRFQGLWNRDMLLVTSPAVLAELLVTKTYQFEKPENGREHLRLILGDGLVVVEGEEHKFQRKRVMPSFSFRHIKDLYPVMWSKAQTLCERIDADFQGQPTVTIDVMEWAARATLDAIGVAALGRDFNSIYNADDELAYLYRLLTEPRPIQQIFFAASMLFGNKRIMTLPLPIIRNIKLVATRLRELCRQLVSDKRTAIAEKGDDHYDILSVLIKSNDFGDLELINQMLTFLAAGSDTTSLTFTWCCFLLAKYPEAQRKLREEIMSVREQLFNTNSTADDGTLATVLESLPYLNGVFHETLRLYPTVPMTMRVANVDTTLVGQPVPKGTELVMSINAINHSPEFWGADAGEFKPERWIDAETNKPNNHGGAISNYCMLTFLAGPRSCIGQNFARAELRCLLAAWIATYEMEDANLAEVVAVGAVTTKPAGGMKMRLTPVASSISSSSSSSSQKA